MDLLPNILQLVAGIGLFLFAMYLLEKSLKNLTGRSFKLFLQRITKNRLGGVAGGAIVTAVLQSSSMVILMVLAFVGAGVFTIHNAMAIILGANLGTTLSNWLVATLGFKMDIQLIAYPMLCIGGFLLVLFKDRRTTKNIAYFLFGFGLLFIGLSFMKTALEEQVKNVDVSQYADMPLVVFLLVGLVLTVLVQSSSVTMALTLSALNAGALDLTTAAALVLGGEVGTNLKLILSGIGGNATKKRVVLGSILFNTFLTIAAFIFLKPILFLITDVFHIQDPLIGLVSFQSFINLASIVIFLPFLPLFVRLLERFFRDSDGAATAFISQANVNEPVAALDLLRRETEYFIHNSMRFVLAHFRIRHPSIDDNPTFREINEKKRFHAMEIGAQYEFLKQLQGEIQAFYLALRARMEQGQNHAQLSRLISSVRSAMYAAKCIKDIGNNIDNLQSSSKDIKYKFFIRHKENTQDLYGRLHDLLSSEQKTVDFEELQRLYRDIEDMYRTALDSFYDDALGAPIENMDLTTVINFNRELFTANKAMLMAVKDLLLDDRQAEEFNEVPVYRT